MGESINEWAIRNGVDLDEMCDCGHDKLSHRGNKFLGGCTAIWSVRGCKGTKWCSCVRYKAKALSPEAEEKEDD